MFTFLLVVHAIVAAALVGVILMQRSEGGGLAGGGSPAGVMSARGAANFMTRVTTILASIFVILSIGMAAIATVGRESGEIDTSLAKKPVASSEVAPAPVAPAVPLGGDTSVPLEVPTPTTTVPAPQVDAALPTAQPKAVEMPKKAEAPKSEAKAQQKAVAPKPAAEAPKATPTAPNSAAPLVVPPSLVTPPTPPATRPEPQPEGR